MSLATSALPCCGADKIVTMKQRFIRVGDELTDDVTVVVRSGDLDPDILRADALRNHSIYGTYGIPCSRCGT